MTVPSTLKELGNEMGLDLSTMLIPSSQVSGNLGGGTDNTPTYTIYKTGANFAARANIAGLSDVAANADAAAVFQACMDNINGSTTPRGLIIFAPNTTFTWLSNPTMRRTYAGGGSDDKKWLRILGSGGSVIQLSATGNCFLYPNKQANDDGFCGLEIGNIGIDANNLKSKYNVLFGTTINNVQGLDRVDIRRIWLHDFRIYNMPVSLTSDNPTQTRGINIIGTGVAVGNVIEDILIERGRQDGGNNFIALYAASGSSNWSGDRWVIRDFYHDSGIIPVTDAGAHTASSCIQVGGFCSGEGMLIENGYLAGCNDDGLEVNTFRTIIVRNVTVARCKTEAFYANNFAPVVVGDSTQQRSQVITFEDCTVLYLDAGLPSSQMNGWGLVPQTTDVGTIILRGCKTVVKAAQANGFTCTALAYSGGASNEIDHLIVEDCTFDNWQNNATASAQYLNTLYFYGTPKRLTIRNLKLIARGAKQSTGVLFLHPFWVSGKSGFNTHVEIDGYELVDQTTGRDTDSTVMLNVGADNVYGTALMSGVFRGFRYRIEGAGGDTAPRAVWVYGQTNMTLKKLIVDTANFSNLSGDSGLLTFSGGGTSNAPFVFVRNFLERVRPPAEITFTPGATTVSAQYIGNFAGLMTITGGTVTVVEVSTDNATFRQVAAGTNVSFYIEHGQYVRLTYTVVPTCRVLPGR